MLTSDEWQDLRTALAVIAHAEAHFANDDDGEREALAAAARTWLADLLVTAPTGEQG